jgi:hypothetical protein
VVRALMVLVVCCLPLRSIEAQSRPVTWPQLAQLSSSSIYPAHPANRLNFTPLLGESPDTAIRQIRPTHWREGGLVGALVLGAFGAWFGNEICTVLESGGCTRVIIGSVVGGGGVGFLIGALIGGQFPRRVAEETADSL